LKKGHKISNDKLNILMSKGLTKIAFDREIKAKDGAVSGIRMIAYNSPVSYIALNNVLKRGNDINKFHKMLGHCVSDRFERTV
jgi:ribosomal protein S3AE